MPMDLTGLFQNLGVWAIAVLGLVYLLRKIFEKWLSQDLESFKARLRASHDAEIERLRADLRAVAFERETRFARLHELRAEVIAELYKRLVWAHTSLLEFIQPIQQGGEKQRKERGRKAADNTNKFFAHFHENYIYFDQSLCSVIETLEEKFRRTWAEFAIFPDMKPASAREWADAWKSFSQDVPPLRHEIEKRFRRMLGVEDE
jgi:hypothetical protein